MSTPETPAQELARLRTENAALKAKKTQITFKVSEKGAVSVYGLGSRFPCTLYKQQMISLLDVADEVRAFIKENDARLQSKGE